MADLKTHLRELSVAVGIYLLKNGKNLEKLNCSDFFDLCKTAVKNDISGAKNVLKNKNFSVADWQIVVNGFALARKIVEKFRISNNPEIFWYGNDTQKSDPIDLVVDAYPFSLKENSFILENMGLYKYINLLTGSDHARGSMHIFKEFAPREYEEWFSYAWQKLVSGSDWKSVSKKRKIAIKHSGAHLLFKVDNDQCVLPQESDLSLKEFENITNPKFREQVFSKWIKATLERKDSTYVSIKKKCATAAGETLVSSVNSNRSPDKTRLCRFLQIYKNSYYYAKTTSSSVSIYKVPSIADFNEVISVKDVYYKVPKSQLNIFTEILNKETGNYLLLRNEVRFSHGQFNGTPEAKLYYDRGHSLDVIYLPV